MSSGFSFRAALIASLAIASAQVLADALSEPPERWKGTLVPVEEVDISGAERLMQEAIPEARAEVAALLEQPEPDPASIAGAYGRLGALYLLVEVEAQADACFRTAQALQPRELRWPYYAGYLAMMAGNADQALVKVFQSRVTGDTENRNVNHDHQRIRRPEKHQKQAHRRKPRQHHAHQRQRTQHECRNLHESQSGTHRDDQQVQNQNAQPEREKKHQGNLDSRADHLK